METNQFDLTQAFRAISEAVARRNHDGTIILMRLDATSLFYKIDGIAAAVWSEFEKPKTASGLIAHFSRIYPGEQARLEVDIPQFMEHLCQRNLIVKAEDGEIDAGFRSATPAASSAYLFGGIKEFSLERIETEVLNETIYLDVFAGSDLRLKKEVTPLQDALAKVVQLEGINYRWEAAKEGIAKVLPSSGLQAGLIAQQVAMQMPELVRADAQTGYLAIEYSKLTAYLVEAIKGLHQRVEQLEAQLAQKH